MPTDWSREIGRKSTTDFSQMLQLLVANQMGLDLAMPKGSLLGSVPNATETQVEAAQSGIELEAV